jgi:hypothetical protein
VCHQPTETLPTVPGSADQLMLHQTDLYLPIVDAWVRRLLIPLDREVANATETAPGEDSSARLAPRPPAPPQELRALGQPSVRFTSGLNALDCD